MGSLKIILNIIFLESLVVIKSIVLCEKNPLNQGVQEKFNNMIYKINILK